MPAIIPSLSAALVAALCLGLLLQWQSLARSVLNIPATSTSSQRASGELETCRSELSYVQRLLLGEKLARVEAPLSELARVEAPLSEEDALIMARLRREGASPGEPWRLLPPLDPPVPPAWEVADPEEVQRCGISLKVLGEGGAASADLCKLDRRLATSLAVSNVLIVTWAAGAAWQPFVFNWVQHLRRINVSNHLVGALDTALLAALLERRVPCFYVNLGATTTGTKVSRESSAFYTLGSHKLHLIAHLLELGVTPLVTDVDLVLLRDPTPYVLRYQRADLLVTSDILWSTVEDDGLEEPNAWRASPLAPYGINFPLRAPNIGAMALRPNNRTRELLERWQTDLQLCLKRKLAGERLHCWDQQFLAWILAQRGEGAYPGERPDGTLLPPMVESRIYMSPSNLTVGFLPVRKFCNGNTFASQRLHLRGVADERLPHVFGDTAGKKHRLREAGLWQVDPPEYHDPPGGVLTYTPHYEAGVSLLTFEALGHPHPPRYGSSEAFPNTTAFPVEQHFRLVRHQLAQLRSALAVAHVLNRSLVVPPLLCGIERSYAPHAGRTADSDLRLPYWCPLDHVLDLGALSHYMNINGLETRLKPSAFLSTAQSPPSLLQDTVSLAVDESCTDSESSVAEGGGRTAGLRLGCNLTDVQIKAHLRPLRAARVLHLSSVRGLFAGFEEQKRQDAFYRLYERAGSFWCCAQPGATGEPGHVWYDLFWEDVGSVDRFGRVRTREWKGVRGP